RRHSFLRPFGRRGQFVPRAGTQKPAKLQVQVQSDLADCRRQERRSNQRGTVRNKCYADCYTDRPPWQRALRQTRDRRLPETRKTDREAAQREKLMQEESVFTLHESRRGFLLESWKCLTANSPACEADKIYEELSGLYSSLHRAYHNLSHIDSLLDLSGPF